MFNELTEPPLTQMEGELTAEQREVGLPPPLCNQIAPGPPGWLAHRPWRSAAGGLPGAPCDACPGCQARALSQPLPLHLPLPPPLPGAGKGAGPDPRRLQGGGPRARALRRHLRPPRPAAHPPHLRLALLDAGRAVRGAPHPALLDPGDRGPHALLCIHLHGGWHAAASTHRRWRTRSLLTKRVHVPYWAPARARSPRPTAPLRPVPRFPFGPS